MTRKTTCPECRKTLRVKGDPSKIRCPGCQTAFIPEYEIEEIELELSLEGETDQEPAAEDDPFLNESDPGFMEASSPSSRSLPIGKLAGAAAGILLAAVIAVYAVGFIRYRGNLKFVKANVLDISQDNASQGVAACSYIIDNADTSTDEFRDAVFKYGVYLYYSGENKRALEHFREKCLDYNIHAEMSAVYVSRILQAAGHEADAVRLAKQIVRLDTHQLPDKFREQAAEIYISSISGSPDLGKLESLIDTVRKYKNEFPLNTSIEGTYKQLVHLKEEEERKAELARLKATAEEYREKTVSLIKNMQEGLADYDAGSYAEAYSVLSNAVIELQMVPFDLDGIESVQKKDFEKSYESFLKGTEGIHASLGYAEVSALGRKVKDALSKIPGKLESMGFVLVDGEWCKNTEEEPEQTEAVGEALNMKELVHKLLRDEIVKLDQQPQSEMQTIIINTDEQKFTGTVTDEKDDSITLQTLFGPVKIAKNRIAERKNENIKTRFAVMKEMLAGVFESPDVLRALQDASGYASRNKMIDISKMLDHCYLYLNPRDLKMAARLGYLNKVYGNCPLCRGSGYAAGGKKKQCQICNGTGKQKCERCHGEGWVKCDNCIQSGIHAGQISETVRDRGGESYVYRECPECRGTQRVKCPLCKGRKFRKTIKCKSCGGTGFIWLSKPKTCPKCKGQRKMINPEYLRDPYSFLLRE